MIDLDKLSRNSELDVPDKLSTAQGLAPSYSARAWVNFNGVGVISIRAAGNVSNVTDLGIGFYRVNFATPMQDVNYSVSYSADVVSNGTSYNFLGISNFTLSFVDIRSLPNAGATVDTTFNLVTILR